MAEPDGKLVSHLLRKPTANGFPAPAAVPVQVTCGLAWRCKARAASYREPGATVIGITCKERAPAYLEEARGCQCEELLPWHWEYSHQGMNRRLHQSPGAVLLRRLSLRPVVETRGLRHTRQKAQNPSERKLSLPTDLLIAWPCPSRSDSLPISLDQFNSPMPTSDCKLHAISLQPW